MNGYNGLSERRLFQERLRQTHNTINRECAESIDMNLIGPALEAVIAARDAMPGEGEGDSKQLMRMATAVIAASRLLDSAGKTLAAQASATGYPVRQAAREIRVAPLTITKWMDGIGEEVALPEGQWWLTEELSGASNTIDSSTEDTTHTPQVEPEGDEQTVQEPAQPEDAHDADTSQLSGQHTGQAKETHWS